MVAGGDDSLVTAGDDSLVISVGNSRVSSMESPRYVDGRDVLREGFGLCWRSMGLCRRIGIIATGSECLPGWEADTGEGSMASAASVRLVSATGPEARADNSLFPSGEVDVPSVQGGPASVRQLPDAPGEAAPA